MNLTPEPNPRSPMAATSGHCLELQAKVMPQITAASPWRFAAVAKGGKVDNRYVFQNPIIMYGYPCTHFVSETLP